MKKTVIACGVALLALVGCGGSDDDSSTELPDDATAATEAATRRTETRDDESSSEATSPPESDDDSGDSDDSDGSGPSTATVTIGGETYEFSTEGAVVAQCQTDMFGIFSVQLPGVDGDSFISIVALLEGTDPAVVEEVDYVEVSIGDEDWVADEESDLFDMSDGLQPGMSQVDSVEVDGSTVRGTATFVRQLSLFVAASRRLPRARSRRPAARNASPSPSVMSC
jgi:hypothetical protein